MLLSSLLLLLDELNFYFTGKQDVIRDHTPAHSITSPHLLHLGLFALSSLLLQWWAVCTSSMGQHLHLWVITLHIPLLIDMAAAILWNSFKFHEKDEIWKHDGASEGRIVCVCMYVYICVYIYIHTCILFFTIIKSKQNKQNPNQRLITYFATLFHSFHLQKNSSRSNVYSLSPISLLPFSLKCLLTFFILASPWCLSCWVFNDCPLLTPILRCHHALSA